MKTASWVILDKETRKGIYETFNEEMVNRLNRELYDAVPVLEYLQDLNRRIKAGAAV